MTSVCALRASGEERSVGKLSLVLATDQFSVSTFDPEIVSSGSVEVGEDGTILVRYHLGLSAANPTAPPGGVQDRTASVQASVRLRPGQTVQIFKSGSRSCELKLAPLK